MNTQLSLTKIFIWTLIFWWVNVPMGHAIATNVSPEDVQSLRLLSHNNAPLKVLIRYDSDPYIGNTKLVAELEAIIATINEQDGLTQTPQQIELITVGSSRGQPPHPEQSDQHYAIHYSDGRSRGWLRDFGVITMARLKNLAASEQLLIYDLYGSGRRLENKIGEDLANRWQSYFLRGPSTSETGNFGGNIEVTPNGILYLGDTVTAEVRDFLIGHGHQDPREHIVLESQWLDVGHIDEFVTTILQPNDPCGFAIVKADPMLAIRLLDQSRNADFNSLIDTGHFSLIMNSSLQNFLIQTMATPGGIQNSSLYQAQIMAAQIIDRNIERLREHIRAKSPACANIKTIGIPQLFNLEPETGKFYNVLPNVMNLLVLRNDLIIPDPLFLPIRNATQTLLEQAGQRVHFVDTEYYSTGGGEIHCGTNVLRHPNALVLEGLH